MILIDFSQVMISNLFVLKPAMKVGPYTASISMELPDGKSKTSTLNFPGVPDKTPEINEDLLRHMVLNSIRYYKMKFSEKYGRLVICCDNRHYWRKDVFKYYKAGRKKNRDRSLLDWNLIFDSLNKLRGELAEYSPYQVVNVDGAEADDLIGVIAKRNHTAEKILVLSGDKDFVQLQKWPNIEQYAPIQKHFISTDNPTTTLREHIMLGDAGDGIPNFKSPDDTFVSGTRQVTIRRVDLERWIKESKPENFCDSKMLRGYGRNQNLIDLDFIPKPIQSAIVTEWDKPFTESRKKLWDYFVKFKLATLADHIGEF
jgi:hypothetical protein